VEPITSAFLPMLHGDQYVRSNLRAHKMLKGYLYPFLMTQLSGDAGSWETPSALSRALREFEVPPRLYRTYGAQWAARAAVLRERPREWYARLRDWLTLRGPASVSDTRAPRNASILRGGFAGFWCRFTPKEKARPHRAVDALWSVGVVQLPSLATGDPARVHLLRAAARRALRARRHVRCVPAAGAQPLGGRQARGRRRRLVRRQLHGGRAARREVPPRGRRCDPSDRPLALTPLIIPFVAATLQCGATTSASPTRSSGGSRA